MYVTSTAAKGWITGYLDGTFLPQQSITCAKVVTLVNRMLNRVCDWAFVNKHAGIACFTDLSKAYWAYEQVMEATNGHDYIRNADQTETWTALHESHT